ncbi:MAG TPA: DUF3108 domain-containing protein [Burkholderiaceae bacterium]|nr:DUF3108 domain-containing protein [Burkholderiaceae bacterium]
MPAPKRIGLVLGVTLAHLLALDAWVRWQTQQSVLADMDTPVFNPTTSLTALPRQALDGTNPLEPGTAPPSTVGQVVQARQVPARVPRGVDRPSRPAPHPKPAPKRDPGGSPPAPSEATSAPQDTTPVEATTPPRDIPAATPLPTPVAATPPEAPPVASTAPTEAAVSASAGAGDPGPQDDPSRWLNAWPRNTRLSYRLRGYFRGDFHGTANVQWQRAQTRYQAQVNLNVALLLSMSLTSQGRILPSQLWPEVYEEDRRGKKRGVRFGDQLVALNNGDSVPRPAGLQDTASQFVQLAQDFSTGRVKLAVGHVVPVMLGRPGGVDEWRYEVVALDTVQTSLGALPAYHLRPQPLANPRGPVSAEIWVAPALQHLPVRIRLTLNPETWMDLTLEQVQQAGLD